LVQTLLRVLNNPDDKSPLVTDWPIELVVRSSTTRVKAKD